MIIKNGNVVLENGVEKKDILIKDGKIAQIADMVPANGEEVIDASGLYVFPGLIDMHVHLREPGFEHKEDIEIYTIGGPCCCSPVVFFQGSGVEGFHRWPEGMPLGVCHPVHGSRCVCILAACSKVEAAADPYR